MPTLSTFAQKALANRSTIHNRPTVVPIGTILSRSWDQNMYIWLRNMCGTEFDLGTVIRILAENASLGSNTLEVLEITGDIPLKALELLGYGFRSRGDFLIYGQKKGSHQKTVMNSTIISDWDWTYGLLQEGLGMSSQNLHDLYTGFIMPALDYYDSQRKYNSSNPAAMNSVLLQMYRSLKETGRVTMLSGNTNSIINHTTALERLEEIYKSGRRYHLSFIDPHATRDRFLCFMGVQKVLATDGLAYVPINWWVPNDIFTSGSGVSESVIWNEKVEGENLEDFLARVYPKAFSIAHFTGAKTLIIKGTSEPVSW